MIKLIIGAVIAVFVVIGGFMIMDPNINVTSSSEVADANKFKYTIEGEISKPGTYSLEEEITLGDLINAAGGITYNADERAYYDNAVVTAGNAYYIPIKYDIGDVCNNNEISKVNLNTASASELKTISGVTSSIADAIVEYRVSNGNYSLIEQLMNVYGIGSATYRKIRNYVILHE